MYLLEIDQQNKALLADIRHWSNVKIAFSENSVWLKDFLPEQYNAVALLQIPYLNRYEVKEGLLFKKGSVLPAKKMPSALLWSPIDKALPIILPQPNFNFFGIHEKIPVQLIPSDTEHDAVALLTDLDTAKQYMDTAPEVRLKALYWSILSQKVLILGSPILPIKGHTFWQYKNMILPTGYDFELPIVKDTILKKINPDYESIILWQTNGTYINIPRADFSPLSISSFRLTF